MKKNNFSLIISLILNFVITFLFLRLPYNHVVYLIYDLFGFIISYFVFEYLENNKFSVTKKNLSLYFTLYSFNALLLTVFSLILNVGFLKAKVLSLVCLGLFILLARDKQKKYFIRFSPYLFLLTCSLFFCLVSQISPLGNGESYTDSSVFRYVGLIMYNGGVPYTDVFDHKGILIYFINYLGLCINKSFGIWIIEVLFLFGSLAFSYKLCCLFAKKGVSLLAVLLAFIPLIYTFEGGNLTEEYAILFIVISLYLFIRDLKFKQNITLLSSFIIGLCFGAVLLLRPNMAVLWVCMSVYILVSYLKEKSFSKLFLVIMCFVLGSILFMIPFITYLLINGAFSDFVSQYIVFNFKYLSGNANETLFDTFNGFANKIGILLLLLFVLVLRLIYKKEKSFWIFCTLYLVLTTFIVIMPKSIYGHYGMILIPALLVPSVLLCDYLYKKVFDFTKNDCVKLIFSSLVLFSFFYGDIVFLIKEVERVIFSPSIYNEIAEVIKSETNAEDNILVEGNNVLIYLKSERFTNLKYAYQSPILSVDDDLKADFIDRVDRDKPKIIISKSLDGRNGYEVYIKKIIKKYYKKIYSDQNGIVYELN